MNTIIDRIENLMQTDDEDREKQSRRLVDEYSSAARSAQEVIDGCFIALCGYSLKTLITDKGIGRGGAP